MGSIHDAWLVWRRSPASSIINAKVSGIRNPSRKVVIYLLVVLIAAALASYGIREENRIGEAWTSTGFTLVGMTIAPIAFIFLIRAMFHVRGRAKLLAGYDVLARWHLSADEWERFKTADRIRGEQYRRLFNDLPVFKGRQYSGIDVIVGRKSALVGDSYHVLRKGGIPGLTAISWLPAPANPECLEFLIVYPRHRSTPIYLAFRFPFPAAARDDAMRVYNHFEPLLRQRPALAFRKPKLTIKVALALALFFGAAAAWGFWRAHTGHANDPPAIVAAVVGSIIAPVALILALLTARMSRPNA